MDKGIVWMALSIIIIIILSVGLLGTTANERNLQNKIRQYKDDICDYKRQIDNDTQEIDNLKEEIERLNEIIEEKDETIYVLKNMLGDCNETSKLIYDVNRDDVVNATDVCKVCTYLECGLTPVEQFFYKHYENGFNLLYDVNMDGKVNYEDCQEILDHQNG